ncbi:Cyclohexadienyl dehydratase [Sodalis praecaptivus]|uniref:Cyclohexadienyl dehydratase n=1 Tax=Sodalis praecaptivus TaxID=1239307 RepID=W0HV87_9GAMM|nr:transporter substrate-binding domain-containing protein [Sodalis praecaptivus]AHF76115.1 Cyclohexadienyl dehydratase [Sodalis praecaptivus]
MTHALRFFLLLSISISGGGWAQSRLDRILQQGVLKVCTTGDYRPYSFLRADGRYEGIDIAMAQSLADSLPARIQWVPTTWKSLMRDFSARDCDIAVGGVSVTLDRQKRASFSLVLSVEGKIPLVRCVDRPQLHSIEQMNQSAVRIIAPAGGSNEAVVRKHLPRATLMLSHDNAAIFQQLVDQKADVMITDVEEALFQQQRYPSLCAVQPHVPIQYGEKAYMLPRDDSVWKRYVDQWLHLHQADGSYRALARQWRAATAG